MTSEAQTKPVEMLTFEHHEFSYQYDECRRCWAPHGLLKARPNTQCQVPVDSLHLSAGPEPCLEWHGYPAYFYFCAACDFCWQLGIDGARGGAMMHECRHGNRAAAPLLSPLEVIDVGLQALHFKKRDPYVEHREKLRGIESVDLVSENDFGDAWSTATWEEL